MGRSKKSGKSSGKGNSLKDKSANAIKNSLADKLGEIFDPFEAIEEAEEGKFGPTDTLLDLGDWELVATPGGPVDPWDCERWPGSIYCDGGWEPGDWAGVGLGEIEIDGCGIMVSIQWSVLGFEMPIVSFGIQSTDPNCQPPPPEEEPPPGTGGQPGTKLPPVPFPGWNPNFLYALTFQQESIANPGKMLYNTYLAWGPVSLQPGAIQYLTGPNFSEPLPYFRIYRLLCAGFSAIDSRTGVPRFGNRSFAEDEIEQYDYLSFPRIESIGGNEFRVLPPSFQLRAPAILFAKEENANGWNQSTNFPYNFGFIDPKLLTLVKARLVGCYGRYSKSYLGQVKAVIEEEYAYYGYSYSSSDWNAEWLKMLGGQYQSYKLDNVWPQVSFGECGAGTNTDDFDGWGKIRRDRINMSGCCQLTAANARRLKRIETVLAPHVFRDFTPSGDVIGKPKASVPGYFLYPDVGDKPAWIEDYPKMFEALFMMMDKNAFIPFDVEIADNNAGKKGNQPLKLRVTNFSAALKELLQLLMDTEGDVDTNNNIAVRQSYELMVMHQLLVKIYCLVEGSADYLGYEMQQKVEKVPMMFTSDPKRQKKAKRALDENEEEATEDLMPGLLQTSEQPVVVERNVQSKDLNETLLEILNLLQAFKGGFTQKA